MVSSEFGFFRSGDWVNRSRLASLLGRHVLIWAAFLSAPARAEAKVAQSARYLTVPASAHESPDSSGPRLRGGDAHHFRPGSGGQTTATPSGLLSPAGGRHNGDAEEDQLPPRDGRDNAYAGEAESLGGTLFSTFLSLSAVVVLIYVTLNFGLRRLMGARGMPFGQVRVVNVLERVTLDPKRALFVVRAAGEYLLVGGGEQGLSLITVLKADEVERALEPDKALAAHPAAFLQKLLSRKPRILPAEKA
jgi:flagellar protein FliO/FliZ